LLVAYVSNAFSFADNVNRVLGRESESDTATQKEIKELEQKVERPPEYLADLPETQKETLRAAYEEARILQLEGYRARNAEKHKEAIERFTAALGLAETDAEMAALHVLCGNSYLSINEQDGSITDLDNAQAEYEEALRLADGISPDTDGAEPRAVALGNLGIIYLYRGDLDKAEEYYQQALDIHREIGNRLGEAQALANLGSVYFRRDEMEKAEEYYKQALETFREIGNRLGEAQALRTLGFAYGLLDHLDRAEAYHKQALEIDREIGNRLYEAADLGSLGNVYFQRGELEKAEDYHKQALEIYREIGNRRGEVQTLYKLSDVYYKRSDVDKAIDYLQQAQAIDQQMGFGEGPGTTEEALAELERRQQMREE